jgi:hypothetical protein
MRHCEDCEVTEVIGAALAIPICATSAGVPQNMGLIFPAFGWNGTYNCVGFSFSTDFLQWRFLAFASKNAPA